MTRLLLITLVVLAGNASAAAVEFFVSPAGQDGDPGTAENPFATLERARDALRQLRSADSNPSGGATLWLRAGDYLRTAALELSAADSGTAEAPVVWRAWQDERVRLLGGRTLSGFQPVTDPAVLNRLDGVLAVLGLIGGTVGYGVKSFMGGGGEERSCVAPSVSIPRTSRGHLSARALPALRRVGRRASRASRTLISGTMLSRRQTQQTVDRAAQRR